MFTQVILPIRLNKQKQKKMKKENNIYHSYSKSLLLLANKCVHLNFEQAGGGIQVKHCY